MMTKATRDAHTRGVAIEKNITAVMGVTLRVD